MAWRHNICRFIVKSTATITDLQGEAPALVRQVEREGVLNITRHGRTVAFMVSREIMEGILETVDLQQNKELMRLVDQDKSGKVKYSPLTDEDEN